MISRDIIDHPLGPDFLVCPASPFVELGAYGWVITHVPSGYYIWTGDTMSIIDTWVILLAHVRAHRPQMGWQAAQKETSAIRPLPTAPTAAASGKWRLNMPPPTETTPAKDELTWAQVKAAREAGPAMLEILCGWITSERTLTGITSIRRKVDAARDLAGLHNSAEALVARVLEATDNG